MNDTFKKIIAKSIGIGYGLILALAMLVCIAVGKSCINDAGKEYKQSMKKETPKPTSDFGIKTINRNNN